MIEVYFGENATRISPVKCVGGLIYQSAKSRAIDNELAALYDSYKIPFYQAASCEEKRFPFDHLDDKRRTELHHSIIENVIAHSAMAVTSAVPIAAYARTIGRVRPDIDDDGFCLFSCLGGVREWLLKIGYRGTIRYFFDANADCAGYADRLMKLLASVPELRSFHFYGSHTLVDKHECRPLQLADLVAWEASNAVACEPSLLQIRHGFLRLAQQMPCSIQALTETALAQMAPLAAVHLLKVPLPPSVAATVADTDSSESLDTRAPVRFCTLTEVTDGQLSSFINRHSRGCILELDEEAEPDTFPICADTLKKLTQMIFALDPKMVHRDRVRPIHFGITGSPVFGAFSRVASKPMPYDFIGIHHGTIADTLELFNRILAHPDNLPNIGDPSKEEAPPFIKREKSALVDKWFRKWVTPKCPVRRYFARSLTYISLELVLFHELAHHANGHIDFLNSNSSASITNQPYCWNEGDRILRQTLEMDADATALAWALDWNERKRQGLSGLNEDANFQLAHRWAYGTRQNYATSLLFAGYATFRNYSEPWSSLTQVTVEHPTPAIRQKFLADGLRRLIQYTSATGYTEEQFAMDAGNVFHGVENAFARINGEPENRDAYNSVFRGPASADYFFQLESRWAEILPDLDKYKKVSVLSPVQWDLMPPRRNEVLGKG